MSFEKQFPDSWDEIMNEGGNAINQTQGQSSESSKKLFYETQYYKHTQYKITDEEKFEELIISYDDNPNRKLMNELEEKANEEKLEEQQIDKDHTPIIYDDKLEIIEQKKYKTIDYNKIKTELESFRDNDKETLDDRMQILMWENLADHLQFDQNEQQQKQNDKPKVKIELKGIDENGNQQFKLNDKDYEGFKCKETQIEDDSRVLSVSFFSYKNQMYKATKYITMDHDYDHTLQVKGKNEKDKQKSVSYCYFKLKIEKFDIDKVDGLKKKDEVLEFDKESGPNASTPQRTPSPASTPQRTPSPASTPKRSEQPRSMNSDISEERDKVDINDISTKLIVQNVDDKKQDKIERKPQKLPEGVLLDKILFHYDHYPMYQEFKMYPAANIIRQIGNIILFFDAYDEEQQRQRNHIYLNKFDLDTEQFVDTTQLQNDTINSDRTDTHTVNQSHLEQPKDTKILGYAFSENNTVFDGKNCPQCQKMPTDDDEYFIVVAQKSEKKKNQIHLSIRDGLNYRQEIVSKDFFHPIDDQNYFTLALGEWDKQLILGKSKYFSYKQSLYDDCIQIYNICKIPYEDQDSETVQEYYIELQEIKIDNKMNEIFQQFYKNQLHQIYKIYYDLDEIKLIQMPQHHKNEMMEFYLQILGRIEVQSSNILIDVKNNRFLIHLMCNGYNPQYFFYNNDQMVKNFRFSGQWDADKTEDQFARSYYYNSKGLMQLHPKFNNIFINVNKKIQINQETMQNKFNDWNRIELQNKAAPRLPQSFSKEENIYEIEESKKSKQDKQFRSFNKNLNSNQFSRRIKLSYDDRVFIPKLRFHEKDSKIYFELHYFKTSHLQKRTGISAQQIVEIHPDIKRAPMYTRLAASSVIERNNNKDDKDGKFEYKQNFQVCILHESGLRCKIKEYQVQWNEDFEYDEDDEKAQNCDILLIGIKQLLFKKPIDNHQSQQLNFISKFQKDSYIIEGTQILPIDPQSNQDHIVLKNFNYQEYQFRGDLINSGVKIYLDEQCQIRQKCILFESRISYKEIKEIEYQMQSELNEKDMQQDGKSFTQRDLSQLLEQQLVTLMNTVPQNDLRSLEKIFIKEEYDFLQPLEIFRGQTKFDYMCGENNYVRDRLLEKEEQEERLEKEGINMNMNKKSYIEEFLERKCEQCERHDFIDEIKESLPQNQGWIRSPYDVSNDFVFQNPISRFIDDKNLFKKENFLQKSINRLSLSSQNSQQSQNDQNQNQNQGRRTSDPFQNQMNLYRQDSQRRTSLARRNSIKQMEKKTEPIQVNHIQNNVILIIEHIFNSKIKNEQVQQILLSTVDKVLHNKYFEKMSQHCSYNKFFEQDIYENQVYSFFQILDDKKLPKYMSDKDIPILNKGYTKEKTQSPSKICCRNIEFTNQKDDENPFNDIKKVVSLKVLENYEETKQKDNDNILHAMKPVKHYLVDFYPLILQQKVNRRFQNKDDPKNSQNKNNNWFERFWKGKKCEQKDNQIQINDYYLSKLMAKITHIYPNEMEKLICLQAVIQNQFKQNTEPFFKKQSWIFLFLNFVPFIAQIVIWQMNHTVKIILTTILLISNVILFCIEFIQIYEQGLKKYLKDIWNWVDVFFYLFQFIFCILRYAERTIDNLQFNDNTLVFYYDIYLEQPYQKEINGPYIGFISVTTLLLLFESFFYLKINRKQSQLVDLLLGVRQRILPFTLFLIIIITFFTIIYTLLGETFNDEPRYNSSNELNPDHNYPYLASFYYTWIQTFQNAIGNIQEPSNSFWNLQIELDKNVELSRIMIYVISFFWLLNQYVIFIILMNFFIGLISQAYEESIGKHQITQYKNFGKLNEERNLFYDFCYQYKNNKNCFVQLFLRFVCNIKDLDEFESNEYVVIAYNKTDKNIDQDDDSEEEDQQEEGIVKKVDRNNKKETQKLYKKIEDQEKRVNNQLRGIKENMDKMMRQINDIQNNTKKDVPVFRNKSKIVAKKNAIGATNYLRKLQTDKSSEKGTYIMGTSKYFGKQMTQNQSQDNQKMVSQKTLGLMQKAKVPTQISNPKQNDFSLLPPISQKSRSQK